MKPSPARYLTLFLLLVLLLAVMALALRGTSRAHFELPPDTAVRVILSPSAAPSPTQDALSQFRTERETAFQDAEETYSALLASVSADDDIFPLAQSCLLSIGEDRRLTLLIETALYGMGYPDAVCAVQDDAVTVFFASPVQANDGAVLCDLITEWSGLTQASIRLIEGL